MSVYPTNYIGGTSVMSSVTSYDTLAARIKNQLGYPLIQLEISDQQIYDNITNAIEVFTKWTGYTEEYLVFNTCYYIPGVGINIGAMINITPEMNTSTLSSLSSGYDFDLNTYRQVSEVFTFEQGESTGINTLFTLEQAMSQQIYASYMTGGGGGFDLISWQVLKGWVDTRKKVLAQNPYFRFDKRTQMLRIIPEPILEEQYVGAVGCYIERSIKDLVQELWVAKFSRVLCQITIGWVRKKYSGTSLFGGGTVDTSILDQGLAEKEKLEKELMESYQDAMPPMFFIG